MGDTGDNFRAFAERRKENRARLGISCPGCPIIQPKRIPTLLMPHMRCKVCGTTYNEAKTKRGKP